MIFKDMEHVKNYNNLLNRCNTVDCYNNSVCYLLALEELLYNNFDNIYDVKNNLFNYKVLDEYWQTSSTLVITRLAYNLYSNRTTDDVENYSVDNIFSKRIEYAPYFLEAIKIRYNYESALKSIEAFEKLVEKGN